MELKPLPIVIDKSMSFEDKGVFFDRKYEAFLRTLAVMPRTNKDNSKEVNRAINKERRDNFRALFGSAWDEFVLDILTVFNINYDMSVYTKSRYREDESDNGMAVLECLNEAIEYFDSADKPEYFRVYIATYKDKKLSIGRISDLEAKYNRFFEESNSSKQLIMIKIFRQMNKLYAREIDEDFDPDMPREVINLPKKKFFEYANMIIESIGDSVSLSEQDMDAFYYMATNRPISLERAGNGEEESAPLYNMVADEEAEGSLNCIENIESIDKFLACVYDLISKKSYLSLKDREIIRIFLTFDILKELKLDNSKKPYTDMPAGNKAVYDLLVPNESKLIGETNNSGKDNAIFFQEFIRYVFANYPSNLMETYSYLLKKGIKLIYVDIQTCMGYISRGTITKKAERYEEIMKGVRLFYEQQ